MAVKKETTIERFTGLSTDTKPTSVRVGSTFFEYDTKLLYFTYDGTNWVIKHLPYGLIFAGTCNSGMTASTVTVASADLAGYGNDYFNGNFYMQVVKNTSSIGSAPDGDFPRKITDYVSSSGTFTVDAFSANVEESDEIFVLHKSIMLILTEVPEVGDWALSDYDLFDVADADADNERWNPEYISGAAGGSADINTSTSGKLHVHAAYNVAGAIRYAVSHNLPFYGDFFKVEEDVSITWGTTASATAKAVGVLISAGTAYDSNNYIAIERQKGTGVDRVQVRYNLNNAGEATVNAAVAVTDDTVAFKIERMDQTWSLFYSTIQMANGVWDWVKVTQVEDTSNYMTNQFTYYQEAFNGAAGDANESAIGDFDNFYYHLGTGGGSQYIAGDYSSAWVSADVDGSVFERLESIQQALSVNASGEFEQDGVPDLWDALVVDSSADANIVLMTGNRDGAIIERLAAIENTIGITNAATLTGYEEDGTGANLFKTLVAVQGATSAAGTTATFVDAARTEGASYWIGNLIVALSGSAAGQVRTIVADSGAGTLTVEPLLSAAPGASAVYAILKQKGVDWIIGDNTADNAYNSGTVGRNDDGSVLERLESIIEDLRGAGGIVTWPGAADIADGVSLAEGLRAVLTSMVGSSDYDGYTNLSNTANASLNAIAQKFGAVIGIDAANTYSTTLQGSARSTIEASFDGLGAYFSASGAAWSVTMNNAAAVGTLETTWEGYLAWLGIDGTNQLSKLSNVVPTTLNAALQSFAATIGIDGTSTYSATIQGAGSSTIEASFTSLASYFSPSSAAWSITMNNGTAKTDLETTWEAWLAVVGVDGTNQFTNISNSANTTFNAVFQKFATVIGIDSANTYAPAMFGATPGTIEASFTALGTALGAEYDGSPDVYDTIVTGYDSSGIAANADGSTLERLEFIQSSLIPDTGGLSFKGTVSTGGSATSNKIAGLAGYGDDYFNTYYYMQIIRTTDGLAPVGEVRKITDYTSADGTFVTDAFSVILTILDEIIIIHETIAAIGRDDADNTISTSVVAANENGSILERLEQIQEAVNVGTGSSLPTNKSLYDIIGVAYVDAGGGFGTDSVLSDLADVHTHADDMDTDLGEPGDAAAINTTVHGKLNGIIAALEITAAGGGKFEVDGAEGLWTQLKEIPASDGSVTWNNTALASIQTEANDALIANSLDNLGGTACGDTSDPVDMTTEVVDHSVIANILTDDGDTSNYDRRYHSQEAIANYVDHLYGVDDRPAATVYPVSVVDESILAFLMSKSASPSASSFSNTTDSFEMLSDKLGAYAGTGGAGYNESAYSELTLLSKYIADGDGDFATGTVLPANKSLYNILGSGYLAAGGGFGTNTVLADLGDVHTHVDDVDTDLGEPADAAAIPGAGTVNAKLTGIGTALGVVASGAGGGFEIDGTPSLYGALTGSVDAVNRAVGKAQIAATTIDLQQAASTYTLFTGTTQDVILESLVFRLPNVNVSDDVNITSISIQIDDTTPQVIIPSTMGAKANLTAEAQLGWTGSILIKTGKLIRLTIAGGPADAATVCDVVCVCRAKVNLGYLA